MLNDRQIADLRARFPILHNKIYLYNCSQGAVSDVVEAGMREYAASWRESAAPWDVWMEKYEEARVSFARFIGARPEEIAIVTSASAGINPIASALRFDERRKVVMGAYEFPTMGHIWLAQRARGAEIQFVESTGNAIPVESYDRAIDRRTLIVPLTQVSFLNGFRADGEAITRLAHERGALVFLDGYQDCGTRPIDVKALGVDFFVTGTLKYLLGPSGLAFLYVREEMIESLVPTLSGWMAQREVFAFDAKTFDLAPAARRFESGTPPIPSIYAAMPAIDLLCRIGPENVAEQIRRLTAAFMEGARELGIATKTPQDSVGPLVVLRSIDASTMVRRLAERNILTSARHDGVRFSFHVYNTLEDVRVALAALEENRDLMVRDGDGA
ncbi:MAG: aminotransferase class V-fold PLP-dependent enzyme [Acidobacteria bacterium]|nr:aminotransferase class V-fold PLP-dependent enzyme [Acidobacteriota bacterium]